jgi:hypothetical protein
MMNVKILLNKNAKKKVIYFFLLHVDHIVINYQIIVKNLLKIFVVI